MSNATVDKVAERDFTTKQNKVLSSREIRKVVCSTLLMFVGAVLSGFFLASFGERMWSPAEIERILLAGFVMNTVLGTLIIVQGFCGATKKALVLGAFSGVISGFVIQILAAFCF